MRQPSQSRSPCQSRLKRQAACCLLTIPAASEKTFQEVLRTSAYDLLPSGDSLFVGRPPVGSPRDRSAPGPRRAVTLCQPERGGGDPQRGPQDAANPQEAGRSEERRVGKEYRSRWARQQ